VIIDQIDVYDIGALEAKNDPPIRADRDAPKIRQIAFELVQPETRQIHVFRRGGSVEARKNDPDLFYVFRVHATNVVFFVETPQTLVP
jgi:hypothetical protein